MNISLPNASSHLCFLLPSPESFCCCLRDRRWETDGYSSWPESIMSDRFDKGGTVARTESGFYTVLKQSKTEKIARKETRGI